MNPAEIQHSHASLYDVPAFTHQSVAELALVLLDKMTLMGYDEMPVDEQVQIRLLRTLLDGWAE